MKFIFSKEKASKLIQGGQGPYVETWCGMSGCKYG